MSTAPRSGVDVLPPEPEASDAATTQTWVRGAGWISSAVVALSLANYLFSLAMARLLPGSEFVGFVGAQSALLVIGTGVMAAVPWVMSRELARSEVDPEASRPGEIMAFGLGAAALQGVVVGVVAAALCWRMGGLELAVAGAAAAFCLALVAAPLGFLQGRQAFRAVAGLRVVEGVVRIGAGLGLVVALDRSAAFAVAGMPIGSLTLVAAGLLLCTAAFPLRRVRTDVLRRLSRQALRLGGVQLMLTFVASIDTIVAAAGRLHDADGFAYQTAALLGRAPMFVGLALAQALYPTLVTAVDAKAGIELRRAVGLYVRCALLAILGCATIPTPVLAVVAGDAAGEVATLLRFTSVTGASIGLAILVATVHQARAGHRGMMAALVGVAVLEPVLLVVVSGAGAVAFAACACAVVVLLCAAVVASAHGWRPLQIGSRHLTCFVLLALAAALGVTVFSHVALWLTVMAAMTAAAFLTLDPSTRFRERTP